MRSLSTILVLSVALAVAPNVIAQESPEVLPKVVQHAQPIYPPLARQTRIQGEVRVKIVTRLPRDLCSLQIGHVSRVHKNGVIPKE